MTYVSLPLEVPDPNDPGVTRVDVQVFGIGHREASYEVRVFLNQPQADETTACDAEHGYAGSFYVFGHGGCVGDAMHCHVPDDPPHRYDVRPRHKLTPQTRVVSITEAWRRLSLKPDSTEPITVALVAATAVEPDGARHESSEALMVFERLAIVSYA